MTRYAIPLPGFKAFAMICLTAAPAEAAAPSPTTSTRMWPTVHASAVVQRAVEQARHRFLAGQPFDRMHVAVLVRETDGSWGQGNVEGDALAYPASCVKLPILVAAVRRCAEWGQAPQCLDDRVRPMIVESDNVATGVVIDSITGVMNVAADAVADAAALEAWIERRRYVERVLAEQGLLNDQRVFTKTYPTNSGEEPNGFEAMARQRLGPNRMSANGAARLMLGIVSGAIEPAATSYMRALLRRPMFSPHSSLGGGLPPGSLHENKSGVAFDTLEDVMYAKLPSGRELIVAAFTNGWDQRESEPWDIARLGRFTEILIERLNWLDVSDRPKYVDRGRQSGRWRRRHDSGALTSRGFMQSTGAEHESHVWPLAPRRDGRFQLAIWYPSMPEQVADLDVTIVHAKGISRVRLNQQMWGARWIELGEFELRQGRGEVRLEAAGPGKIAADTLRIAPYRTMPRF